jgi:L-fuculose-phosphate aldolase
MTTPIPNEGTGPLAEFQMIGRDLFLAGLCSSHAGNMSVRLPDDRLLITRTGAMLGRLGPGDLIPTGIGADDAQTPRASSELPVHRAIYRRLPGAAAIVHAHPPAAVALSFGHDTLVPLNSEGLLFLPSVPVLVPQHEAGSSELAAAIAETLAAAPEGRLMMVRGHGCFAAGPSLERAYQWVSCFEEACKILIYAHELQRAPGAPG